MKKTETKMAVKVFILFFLAFAVLGSFGTAQAAYPEKPVKIIVPYPPGGSADTSARIILTTAHLYFPQPFVITNVAGAAGAIGTAQAAKAKPDGYTLFIGLAATNTFLPLSQKLPYSKDDFIPIAQLTSDPTIFGVLASSPYKSIKDIIAKAKKEPNVLKYSTAGVNSSHHVPTALFCQKTGIKMKHIPFDGGAKAMTALLGGHVDLNPNFSTPFASPIKAGKIRPLAVSSSKRIKAYPDVPTLKEEGIDMVVEHWLSVMVPKGTPDDIVKKLRETFAKICADKTYLRLMENMGAEVAYLDGPEFQKSWDKSWNEMKALFESGVMNE